MSEFEFVECAACAAKPGSPSLCAACLQNRATINELRGRLAKIVQLGNALLGKTQPSVRAAIKDINTERETLLELYAVAARLQTFPVPFEAHFELVGAVDKCRSILEPAVDSYSERTEPLL